jgi:uncharacterized coiled-coil protein SlyX|tara:strand:+ start:263 stop:535 length:273 start_codon:yes stop_codon:yes gene_type:complete
MNKYEIKYLLETMTSSVDRLTDSLGKQSHHISELWTEIGHKQDTISNQRYEIRRLKEKLLELQQQHYNNKVDEAKFEKSIKDIVGEHTDN